MDKKAAIDSLEKYRQELYDLSDQIWMYSETAFKEFESCKALSDFMEAHGFKVERGLGVVPTSFSATFGSGKPVIGLLGEYDALAGVSNVPEEYQLHAPNGKSTHQACGHNLLGVGSIAAALIVKEYLEDHPGQGTVIYYGCPAEEGGSGKAFMARDGIFDGLDAAITWHPSSINEIAGTSSLANVQVRYQYKGISAHAAGDPEHGRSALDALELLNIGVQFLREHMPSDARIHYAITDTGGKSPNVVQSYAEAIYLIRSPKNEQVQELMKRVDNIAKGAALMTDTELNKVFMKGCSNTVINTTLNEVLYKNLCELPIPPLTAEEAEYRSRVNATVDQPLTPKPHILATMTMEEKAAFIEKCKQDDIDFVFPLVEGPAMGGSTDVADVSWICPTAQVHTATWCSRSPGHSWQNVAQGIGSAAKKRTMFAGQVMAASVIDLFNAPETVEKAKEELKMREPGGYKCPIPKGVMPQPTV